MSTQFLLVFGILAFCLQTDPSQTNGEKQENRNAESQPVVEKSYKVSTFPIRTEGLYTKGHNNAKI